MLDKRWTVPARAVSVIVVVAGVAIGSAAVWAGGAAGVARARTTAPSTHARSVAGKIREVDGVRAAGRCGTAGAKGTFVVASIRPSASAVVEVNRKTKFIEPMTIRASFADVCVGRSVAVQGTTTKGVVSAVSVFVTTPGRVHPEPIRPQPVLPPTLRR